MKLKLVLFFLSCTPLIVCSQTIKGKVIDVQTGELLPYANIVLLNKNKGTTTDEKGKYEFDISGETTDTLLVSYLGYITQKITLEQFFESENNVLNIKMLESSSLIDEVVLEVKKAKYTSSTKINIKKKKTHITTVPYGYERVVLIENEKGKKGKLESLSFFFVKNTTDDYEVYPCYFRIKFYRYNKGVNLPEELLSYEEIIIKPKNETKKFEIDLNKYNIMFPVEGICVGLESIKPEFVKKPNTIMYTTAPRVSCTNAKTPLMWTSFMNKKFILKKNRYARKVFGSTKHFYVNLLVQMSVQYRK